MPIKGDVRLPIRNVQFWRRVVPDATIVTIGGRRPGCGVTGGKDGSHHAVGEDRFTGLQLEEKDKV